MERVTFHRRVDLKAGWLTSQRHGFLATRHQSLSLMMSVGLLLLVPIVWGGRQMMFSESVVGWVVGFIAAITGMTGLVSFYAYRYWCYRKVVQTSRSQWGDLLSQEITLNRHGVRFTQTGQQQRFYPWWQIGYRWQRRGLDLHLFLSKLVLHIKFADLSPKQVEQIREWIAAAKQPYTKCKQCGYDLRGSHGPSCPECGFDIPAHHMPTF